MANIYSISDYGISARGFAEFLDGIPAAVYRTTIEGKIVYCKQAFASLFGYGSASDLIDFPVIELYRNKRKRGVFIRSILQRGRIVDLPMAFKMRDGTSVWCAVTAKAVMDDDGMVIHLDGVIRDITGEIEVQKDPPGLNGVADESRDMILVIDLLGEVIDINPAGANLLGISKSKLPGKPLSTFFVPEDREFFLIFLADIIKIGRHEAILAVMDHSGKKRYLDWDACLIRYDGRPHHIKCIARDVSDVVNRRKERSNDQKFQGVLEMAGGVAHSLNQPLTIVTNLLNEVLSELGPEGTIYAKIARVQEQIRKMNTITQKISNIKKYEAMEYVAGVKIVDIDKASWSGKTGEHP